jgi:hypothetical protein
VTRESDPLWSRFGRHVIRAPRQSRRREQDEAHISAEQSQACPEARLPPPYVDPRRPGHRESPSPSWSREALSLTALPASCPHRRVHRATTAWTQALVCPSNAWPAGRRSLRSDAPGAAPVRVPSGYTTHLRYLLMSPAESPIPRLAGWVRRRSVTGIGAAFARPLAKLSRRYRQVRTSSVSSLACGTSRSKN